MATYKRLLQFAARYKGRLFLALVCTLLGAVFNTLSIGLIKPVFDLFLSENPVPPVEYLKGLPPLVSSHLPAALMDALQGVTPISALMSVAVLISVAMLFKGVFNYLAEVTNNQVSNRVGLDIRSRLFSHFQDLPLSFHSHQRGGQLISRFTNDAGIMPSGIFDVFGKFARSATNIVGLGILIFWVNWRLALLVILIFPIAIGPLIRFGRKIRQHSTEGQEKMAEIMSLLHENLAGIRIVKAFGLEKISQGKMDDSLHGHFRAVMRQIRAGALSSPVMEFIGGGLALPLLFYIAGRLVLAHTMTAGDFVTFIGAVAALYPEVKNINGINVNIQNSLAASARVFAIMDLPVQARGTAGAKPVKPMRRSLAFQKVGFSYVPARPVLEGIDLEVRSGQMVALVGPSGAGKTTLADLVLRFQDPTAGRILLDGQDIKEGDLGGLRAQIGMVTQETFLFNDSIAANIAYGRPGAGQAEIEAAAKAANAHDFIVQQAEGYATHIGDRGVRLSGGQRQRLAIARAILKNPPLLILDEATSALDTQSERLVQQAMDRLMKKRTTLVIAHRLSTVRHADRIVVLAKGRIVESGRHAELIRKRGLYARLYRMQFRP